MTSSIEIKKILKYLSKPIKKFDNRPVYNFFKTGFNKTVLISYIVSPFRKGVYFGHNNSIESLEIAKTFKNLGYNVDIIDYTNEKKIDYSKYSVVFGFGKPFENSFYSGAKIKRIYYGTTCDGVYQNEVTLNRLFDFYKKKKKLLFDSCRLNDESLPIQTRFSNALILLGNEFVSSTYKNFNGKRYSLHNSYYNVLDSNLIIQKKNFSSAKKNFVFFSGGGLIHKGLDILLDFFKEHKEYTLHICAPTNVETDFVDVYKHELFDLPNIHTHGFIDLRGEKFKEIVQNCAFVILPSCSEGEPASVLNCMAAGLVPVVTESSGITIKNFGILIKALNISGVGVAINEASKLPSNKIKSMSVDCSKYTLRVNSLENFSKTLNLHLKNILHLK